MNWKSQTAGFLLLVGHVQGTFLGKCFLGEYFFVGREYRKYDSHPCRQVLRNVSRDWRFFCRWGGEKKTSVRRRNDVSFLPFLGATSEMPKVAPLPFHPPYFCVMGPHAHLWSPVCPHMGEQRPFFEAIWGLVTVNKGNTYYIYIKGTHPIAHVCVCAHHD